MSGMYMRVWKLCVNLVLDLSTYLFRLGMKLEQTNIHTLAFIILVFSNIGKPLTSSQLTVSDSEDFLICDAGLPRLCHRCYILCYLIQN